MYHDDFKLEEKENPDDESEAGEDDTAHLVETTLIRLLVVGLVGHVG